jgi:superfamily II DNA or RNA helicase
MNVLIYKAIIEDIMDKYHSFNVEIFQITCETNKDHRKNIINKFKKNEDYEVIKIILSIRTLDEGVNIIKCDSIFLSYLSDSINYIRIAQRIMRANRLDPDNPNKIASIFIWREDKNEALQALQLLKSNDNKFNKKISINNDNYGSYDKNNKTIDKNIIDANNDFIEFININCLTEEEIWEKKKELLFEFCNINKDI